jgi:pyruvate carboxylase
MGKIFLILTMAAFLISCATAKITDNDIQARAQTLDFGDSSSATLAGKAWQASDGKDYPALFAYTQKCVELYGAEGKRMNDALTAFEPPDRAAKQWALNDVGTCLFIMANAYVELEMYPEAVETYKTLANDYKYSQCWDPKGWFWHPAANADMKAEQYKYMD